VDRLLLLHVHRIFREALSHGIKWGALMRYVCDAVDPPETRRKEMTALDAAGIERFLDAAFNSPYGAFFFLGIYTGLRRGEMLGLRWTAINLQSRTLSVTKTIQRVKGKGLVSLEPKTDRSRRSVSPPTDAVALLSVLKISQREEREAIGLDRTESNYVFSHIDGRPFHPDTVSHTFADIIKESGPPHLRLHDLRYTHATMMMELGINPKVISERLGHASVVITLDLYSHVSPRLQEEAAEKFGEELRAKVGNRIPQG